MTSELGNMRQRVLNMVARGVIDQSDDTESVQQIQVSLLADESKAAVERFQNYGFSSNPPADTEVVVVFVGGGRDHGVIVAADNRDQRFTELQPGEVAVYSGNGDSIVFKTDNTIEFVTKKLVIKAEESVRFETPLVEATGDVIADADGARISLKSHPHSNSGGVGIGGPPVGSAS